MKYREDFEQCQIFLKDFYKKEKSKEFAKTEEKA